MKARAEKEANEEAKKILGIIQDSYNEMSIKISFRTIQTTPPHRKLFISDIGSDIDRKFRNREIVVPINSTRQSINDLRALDKARFVPEEFKTNMSPDLKGYLELTGGERKSKTKRIKRKKSRKVKKSRKSRRK
jgi:hypothetical protein